jgi:predicted amidohydrolase
MRVILAEVRCSPGQMDENIDRIEKCIEASPDADLIAFPELFLSGYNIGDRLHMLALTPQRKEVARLKKLAAKNGLWLLVGAPYVNPLRRGETLNAALLIGPKGQLHLQGKRFLPTFGPFEEGRLFSPAEDRDVFPTPFGKVGLLICYEAFFPEVTRQLALNGADLFMVISASLMTSRSLFEKVLPARAVENSTPLIFVNRMDVEDNLVFGGGSAAWDPRGEQMRPEITEIEGLGRLLLYDLPLEDYRFYRPMRPVLRDVASAGRNRTSPAAPGK